MVGRWKKSINNLFSKCAKTPLDETVVLDGKYMRHVRFKIMSKCFGSFSNNKLWVPRSDSGEDPTINIIKWEQWTRICNFQHLESGRWIQFQKDDWIDVLTLQLLCSCETAVKTHACSSAWEAHCGEGLCWKSFDFISGQGNLLLKETTIRKHLTSCCDELV